VPIESVINEVRNGSAKEYTTRQKHKRVCYVVAEEGEDKDRIAKEIREMPYYFSDYDVEVHFISSAEMERDHSGMAHVGHVFRNGETDSNEKYSMEFAMRFDSNPSFTASIMAAFARAAFRLYKEKNFGAKTALDIPLSYLSKKDRKELIKEML